MKKFFNFVSGLIGEKEQEIRNDWSEHRFYNIMRCVVNAVIIIFGLYIGYQLFHTTEVFSSEFLNAVAFTIIPSLLYAVGVLATFDMTVLIVSLMETLFSRKDA